MRTKICFRLPMFLWYSCMRLSLRIKLMGKLKRHGKKEISFLLVSILSNIVVPIILLSPKGFVECIKKKMLKVAICNWLFSYRTKNKCYHFIANWRKYKDFDLRKIQVGILSTISKYSYALSDKLFSILIKILIEYKIWPFIDPYSSNMKSECELSRQQVIWNNLNHVDYMYW